MCEERMPNLPETRVPSDRGPSYWIERLDGDQDLDGVLYVESESFTNPWTREMYAWELQNRAVCHIYVVRTAERPVVGFCAFWLVVDEIHINNVAVLPDLRGQGIGRVLMQRVFDEARQLGARRSRSARQTMAHGGSMNAWGFTLRERDATITRTRSRMRSSSGVIARTS